MFCFCHSDDFARVTIISLQVTLSLLDRRKLEMFMENHANSEGQRPSRVECVTSISILEITAARVGCSLVRHVMVVSYLTGTLAALLSDRFYREHL